MLGMTKQTVSGILSKIDQMNENGQDFKPPDYNMRQLAKYLE